MLFWQMTQKGKKLCLTKKKKSTQFKNKKGIVHTKES